MWHLPQFSKRLEFLIKPSGFGYNAYNQAIVVKIPNQVIPYLTEYYYISFVDIEGNTLYFSSRKFSPETNTVEYYIKLESIDDINYTSLFIYYDVEDAECDFDPYVYATWNPNDKYSYVILSNGNLTAHHEYLPSSLAVRATMSKSSGKWYWEVAFDNYTNWKVSMGIGTSAASLGQPIGLNVDSYGWTMYYGIPALFHDGVTVPYGTVWQHYDVLGFAFDATNGNLWFSRNGVWQESGDPATGANPAFTGIVGTYFPMISFWSSNIYLTAGFFADDLSYTPPSGFNAGFYEINNEIVEYVFDGSYVVNFLDVLDLVSAVGPNFSNYGAALRQPICDTYAVKILGGTTYVSCSISKSIFTLFFNCYIVSGDGYLVYFSSSNYIYINTDGSLTAKINGIEYTVGAKLYFDVCSTFSITCDGEDTYVIINGLTKLTIKQTFSISEMRLGGNGSSGYSVEGYFFDLFLLSSKLPLYSYYLHNTRYDNINFFRESGYDNHIVNGYLTHWPEVLFSGDEAIFRSNSSSGVVYSASFDGGNNWHVSNLNYDSIFTRYFGSPFEFDTTLKLTHSSGIINKDYITKVNDFNKFSINYDVNFSIGNKKKEYLDIIIDFETALCDKNRIITIPTEYEYGGGIADLEPYCFVDRPVEFSWSKSCSSGIISRTVEFCFDTTMSPWFEDVYTDFELGRLHQDCYVNIFTDFVVESKNNFYEDIGVDFTLANWKYFPYSVEAMCSIRNFYNENMEISTASGFLMRFVSDVKVSDMLYADFSSSIFCSVSGISPYYFSNIQVISGTLASYDSDICCSTVDFDNYCTEIKLNTIVVENFNISVGDYIVGDFCFNVDIYDEYYGVTKSGINIYMNTNIIVGNRVSSLIFTTISGGNNVSWCYDINLLSPLEYVEIIVCVTNNYGDINKASYFLKYGERYCYNLYHIIKHGYEELIPMLMLAENTVDIFPAFSAETMYVRVENYKRKDLSASIFGIGLDRSDLSANINPITTNFYSGGAYKVRVECKDLSGNIMNPFEFEFIIRSDGL